MNYNYENDETEIRLDDLILYVLLHWKSLVLGLLAGALLLGGVSFCKQLAAVKAREAQGENQGATMTSLDADTTLKAIESSLTSVRLEELDRIAQQKINALKFVEKQERYLGNSLLMQLNPNDYLINTLKYNIELPKTELWRTAEQAETLSLITEMYSQKVLSDELFQEAAKELNTSIRYVKELVSFSSSLANKDGVNNYVIVDDSEEYQVSSSVVITIKVRAANDKECELISEKIKQYLEEPDDSIVEETGDYSIKLLTDTTTAGDSSDAETVITAKRANVLTQINSNMGYVLNRWSMTTDEQKYVDSKVEEYCSENPSALPFLTAIKEGTKLREVSTGEEAMTESMVSDEELETGAQETEPVTATVDEAKSGTKSSVVTALKNISKKWIALGLLAGMFIVAAFWMAKYILSTVLNNPYALSDSYGVRTMFYGKERLRGLSALRYRNAHIYQDHELAKVIAAETKSAIEGTDKTQSLFILGSGFSDEDTKLISLIKEDMKGSEITVYADEKAIYDPEVIEPLNNAGAVVVIESLKESRNFEIAEEMNYLRSKERDILTAVIRTI